MYAHEHYLYCAHTFIKYIVGIYWYHFRCIYQLEIKVNIFDSHETFTLNQSCGLTSEQY